MRKEFINEEIDALDTFTKLDEEGNEHNYISQRFGVTARIGAAHFALPKQFFMDYINWEVMKLTSDLIDHMQKEWEKQNGQRSSGNSGRSPKPHGENES